MTYIRISVNSCIKNKAGDARETEENVNNTRFIKQK